MIRISLNITKALKLGIQGAKEELAEKISVIVDEEFIKLLNNTPQSYGNYVANMGLRLGTGGRLKAPTMYYPTTQTNKDKMSRGSTPAIGIALQNSSDFPAKMKARAQKTTFSDMSFTIYNNMHYAEKVEGYTSSQLRSVNAGGEHAMAQAEASLRERFSQRIVI